MNKPEKEITRRKNGSKEREAWRLNGKYHREDGPAYTYYYKNGSVEREIWYFNGNFHREDGPAYACYREGGSIEAEAWYFEGRLHREDGPAYIHYRKDGSVEEESWHFEDEQLFKGRFKSLEQIKRMKAFRLFTPVELAKMRCEVINE